MHLLRSQKTLFDTELAFIGVSHGAGPAAEAEQRQHSGGSQVDLLEGMETGESYLLPQPLDSAAVLQDRKRLLLPGERTQRFSFLSLRRMSARAIKQIKLFIPHCGIISEGSVLDLQAATKNFSACGQGVRGYVDPV